MTSQTYELVLAHLAADPRTLLVYGFGSSVHGDPALARDLDVAVMLDRALSWDEEATLRAELLAIEPRVDLVLLRDATPALAWEVVSSGRCLHARDPIIAADFELRSLSRFQDYQPVRRVQQTYLRARIEERRGSPT